MGTGVHWGLLSTATDIRLLLPSDIGYRTESISLAFRSYGV
jgi:hypothetical protein